MLWSRLRRKKFVPAAYYKDLTGIDWERIYALGYRLILVDADNTLIMHGQRDKSTFSETALKKIKAANLAVSILSNASAGRAAAVGEALGVPAEGMANKPGSKGILRACAKFNVDVKKTILVGDQYFTDMLAGRNAGCQTILVDPLGEGEPWYIRLKRWQERRIYKSLGNKSHYDDLPDVNHI